MFAHCLSNYVGDWDDTCALMANHLAPLDKCPSVQPIGIGEVLQRILGKAIAIGHAFRS